MRLGVVVLLGLVALAVAGFDDEYDFYGYDYIPSNGRFYGYNNNGYNNNYNNNYKNKNNNKNYNNNYNNGYDNFDEFGYDNFPYGGDFNDYNDYEPVEYPQTPSAPVDPAVAPALTAAGVSVAPTPALTAAGVSVAPTPALPAVGVSVAPTPATSALPAAVAAVAPVAGVAAALPAAVAAAPAAAVAAAPALTAAVTTTIPTAGVPAAELAILLNVLPPNLPLQPIGPDPLSLGPIRGFPGTWVGSGFNLISLPDFSNIFPSTGPLNFRLLLNSTSETLVFTDIPGAIPNRGVVAGFNNFAAPGQPDINIFGLTYLQKINDAVSGQGLHIEPGIWINVPPTTVFPVQGETAVRMGNIPHGDSILAQSVFFGTVNGPPLIPVISSLPVGFPGGGNYLAPFNNPPLPPGIPLAAVTDPNVVLRNAIAGQNIIQTSAVSIATQVATAGIVNIPFVVENADATFMFATFWVETVLNADGTTFQQLQYSQHVNLRFLGIDWPHITVATLVLQ